jgi:hypothetical protein
MTDKVDNTEVAAAEVSAPAAEPDGLSAAEVEAAAGAEELPDREQMSLVNANVAIPINAAIAANVLSDDATAYADAVQDTPIDQSI